MQSKRTVRLMDSLKRETYCRCIIYSKTVEWIGQHFFKKLKGKLKSLSRRPEVNCFRFLKRRPALPSFIIMDRVAQTLRIIKIESSIFKFLDMILCSTKTRILGWLKSIQTHALNFLMFGSNPLSQGCLMMHSNSPSIKCFQKAKK